MGNSPLSTVFLKALYSSHVKSSACLGKGEKHSENKEPQTFEQRRIQIGHNYLDLAINPFPHNDTFWRL